MWLRRAGRGSWGWGQSIFTEENLSRPRLTAQCPLRNAVTPAAFLPCCKDPVR